MGHESTPGQNVWHGFVSTLRWLVRILVVSVALYIFFPPFWDALFAANLKALHDAPYRAADRARDLWNGVRTSWGEAAGSSRKRSAEALANDGS